MNIHDLKYKNLSAFRMHCMFNTAGVLYEDSMTTK
jgi:hypothetical protein